MYKHVKGCLQCNAAANVVHFGDGQDSSTCPCNLVNIADITSDCLTSGGIFHPGVTEAVSGRVLYS